MAPNGKSEIHVDAYQSDANSWSGPLGSNMGVSSTFQGAECASHTFDSAGRLVTVCVGLQGPTLEMFDPQTLELLAAFPQQTMRQLKFVLNENADSDRGAMGNCCSEG